MTLEITVAAPFKHTRKTGMRKNELVYYYALDRKWMSTDQAAILLKRAEEAGLLKQENGVYTILSDPSYQAEDGITNSGYAEQAGLTVTPMTALAVMLTVDASRTDTGSDVTVNATLTVDSTISGVWLFAAAYDGRRLLAVKGEYITNPAETPGRTYSYSLTGAASASAVKLFTLGGTQTECDLKPFLAAQIVEP